jgi:CHAT domain
VRVTPRARWITQKPGPVAAPACAEHSGQIRATGSFGPELAENVSYFSGESLAATLIQRASRSVDYIDFEIEIGKARGRVYPVAVLRSPAGETRAEMRLPFTGEGLRVRLALLESAVPLSGVTRLRKATTPEEPPIQAFGDMLFTALFTGQVLGAYDASQRSARENHGGLRIKLRVQAPELAVLPWEFLYDARYDDYLCLSRRTPLVRHVLTSRPPMPLAVQPPLRILGMVASPAGLPPLDALTERARLERALHEVTQAGRVELEWLSSQTWEALRDALGNNRWHVLHFVGHGSYDSEADEGLLALADEAGNKHLLTATQIGHLLADNDDLRLVVLNACEGARGSERDLYSSTAARLVTNGGLAAVVAMQYEISDEAAIQFAKQFYTLIARGAPVDAAVAEARLGISVETRGSAEWGTPVLYMQSPDGRIFDIPPEAKPPETVRRLAPVAEPAAPQIAAPAPPGAPAPTPPVAAAAAPTLTAVPAPETVRATPRRGVSPGILRFIATAVIILTLLAFAWTWMMSALPSRRPIAGGSATPLPTSLATVAPRGPLASASVSTKPSAAPTVAPTRSPAQSPVAVPSSGAPSHAVRQDA